MSTRQTLGLSLAVLFAAVNSVSAAPITIRGHSFELDQFNGAAVTYRPDGMVAFDGKLWDQAAGVDRLTTGELAEGQFGSDPGDQLTLQDRGATADWFQLTYSGNGLLVDGSGQNLFVLYEIASDTAPIDPNTTVDVEGTSFRISFNGGSFFDGSDGMASLLDFSTILVDGQPAENVNRIVFDLFSFGFGPGDALKSIRVENLDSGTDTSDPDFIFTALTGAGTFAPAAAPVPEPASLAIWAMLGVAACVVLRRRSHQIALD